MCVAAGFSAVSTADGQSYQRASGIALTLIAVGTAVVFALFARGVARARPWTRTPVVMTQLAIGVWAIYLLRDHRLEWGVPMLLVAACCLAALFTPASLRALNRSPVRPQDAPERHGLRDRPALFLGGQALAQLSQGPGQQPGHVHL